VKGSLEELGQGHWGLRVFAGREAGKVRRVSRNFKGTKRRAESELVNGVLGYMKLPPASPSTAHPANRKSGRDVVFLPDRADGTGAIGGLAVPAM
jgi:hypothetical protein